MFAYLKAPARAKEIPSVGFLPPLPGLKLFLTPNPRFHRGLFSVATPCFIPPETQSRSTAAG
jgi:hypothetical protein